MTKTILVTGATGHQGTALVHALHAPDVYILALTRNPTSSRAKLLANKEYVTVIQGDLDDPASVRRVFEEQKSEGGVWGVFCVLAFPGLGAEADGEERQGKVLADLSVEYGVSVYVLSTVERGGEVDDKTLTLDRQAKVQIERHVRESSLSWTILRPAFFMENYEGMIGTITVGVLISGLAPTTQIQLVAVDDIGRVAASVLLNPEPYKHKIVSIYGELSTMREQTQAYKEVTGHSIPSIPAFLAKALIAMNRHTKGLLKHMERVHEILMNDLSPEAEEQLALARTAYPEMTTFRKWVESKTLVPAETRSRGWNKISLWALTTGKQ